MAQGGLEQSRACAGRFGASASKVNPVYISGRPSGMKSD